MVCGRPVEATGAYNKSGLVPADVSEVMLAEHVVCKHSALLIMKLDFIDYRKETNEFQKQTIRIRFAKKRTFEFLSALAPDTVNNFRLRDG